MALIPVRKAFFLVFFRKWCTAKDEILNWLIKLKSEFRENAYIWNICHFRFIQFDI